MSASGGDSWAREAQHRKRRLDDLLLSSQPSSSSYKKLSNGKLACLVCSNAPILDSPTMLSMHCKGTRHVAAEERVRERKLEIRAETSKKIALSTPSDARVARTEKPVSSKSDELIAIPGRREGTQVNGEWWEQRGKRRERELEFTAAGWKRDGHGRWYRDENPTRSQVHAFPGAAGSQIICFHKEKGRRFLTRSKQLVVRNKIEEKKSSWLARALGNDDISSNFTGNTESPLDIVRNFYRLINSKDLKMLGLYFSADCEFEDLAFSKPFQGTKEVESFLKDLMEAMGDNVKFVLHKVQYGSESSAAVMWHLEWNGKTIPFTRGCSFFECQESDERLRIKKAYVVVESPFKPGRPVLELLKIVTSVFDNYPDIAERFLQKPYAVLQYVAKMYRIFVEPFILPLLIYYSQLWKHIVNALRSLVDMITKILQSLK